MNYLKEKNINELKNNMQQNLVIDVGDNLSAKVLVSKKGSFYKATVSLRTKNPDKTVSRPKSCTNYSLEATDTMIGVLIYAQIGKYQKKPKRTNVKKADKDFAARVNLITEVWDPISYGIRRGGHYLSKSTVNGGVTLLTNTMGKCYVEYGFDATTEEIMDYIDEKVVRPIYEKQGKRIDKNGNMACRTYDNIRSDFYKRLSYAEEARQILIKYAPEQTWPTTPLPVILTAKGTKNETVKIVPYQVFIKAVAIIVYDCKAKNPLAFAALGEVLIALRVGESDALIIGNFEIHVSNKFGRYYVHQQVDNSGELTNALKNAASNRYIPICGLFLELLNLRIQQLQAEGFPDEEIAKMPLGASDEDAYKFMRKDKVSAYLRNVLKKAGLSSDFEKSLEDESSKGFGYDADNDYPAHTFRKIITTLLANGGTNIDMVDAIIGHDNQNNNGKDYASWEAISTMVYNYNRCINLGQLTDNDAFNVREIGTQADYILKGNMEYSFVVDEDCYIDANFECLEPNSKIKLTSSQAIETFHVQTSYVSDQYDSMSNRPILSNLPDTSVINEWIDSIFNPHSI